jgi:hypothetical protein
MSKVLTEELIIAELEKKGILDVHDIDTDEQVKLLCSHYDATFTESWNSFDIAFYTESTADGYEVYIATENDMKISITEDVYYYESDWFEKLPEALQNGSTIQIDEYAKEDNYGFQDAVSEAYVEFYEEIWQEIEQELEDQGYEWPEKNK